MFATVYKRRRHEQLTARTVPCAVIRDHRWCAE